MKPCSFIYINTYKMAVNLDKNIYRFIHEIKKEDLFIINPSTSTNLKKSADIIFESAQTSNPVDICNSFLRYQIEVTNIKLPAVDFDNTTLTNNFFPSLFNSMRLTLGTYEIENIENPGEIPSILNFILFALNIIIYYNFLENQIIILEETFL